MALGLEFNNECDAPLQIFLIVTIVRLSFSLPIGELLFFSLLYVSFFFSFVFFLLPFCCLIFFLFLFLFSFSSFLFFFNCYLHIYLFYTFSLFRLFMFLFDTLCCLHTWAIALTMVKNIWRGASHSLLNSNPKATLDAAIYLDLLNYIDIYILFSISFLCLSSDVLIYLFIHVYFLFYFILFYFILYFIFYILLLLFLLLLFLFLVFYLLFYFILF